MFYHGFADIYHGFQPSLSRVKSFACNAYSEYHGYISI